MSTSGVAARPHHAKERAIGSERSVRDHVTTVVWFFGLSLGLALAAVVAGTSAAVLPFILALGPTFIAIVLAWREGHGALRRLGRSLILRPARRRWYLVLGIPLVWSLATVGIAVVLGAPSAGLFDRAFPAALIIFLVVLLPAFAEEVAWRGFVLPRLMSAMSPLRAAFVVAIPWTIIHVGLFLPGQSNEFLALWPLGLGITAYSVILSWVFIRTGGSVLVIALLHAGLNAVAPVMVGVEPNTQWAIRNVLAAVIALIVIGSGGFVGSEKRLPALVR